MKYKDFNEREGLNMLQQDFAFFVYEIYERYIKPENPKYTIAGVELNDFFLKNDDDQTFRDKLRDAKENKSNKKFKQSLLSILNQ